MKKTVQESEKKVTFPCWCGWNYIGELLEFGHKKAIHIVGMRVKPPSEPQCGMESAFFEPRGIKQYMLH